MLRSVILSLVAPAVVLCGSTSAGSADTGPGRSAPELRCPTQVVAVEDGGHVRVVEVRNDKVTGSRRSRATLPFTATAWGLYDSQETRKGEVLRLDTVSADGKPRRVTLTLRGRNKVGVESSSYDQEGFTPRLFADGEGFHAYTVDDAGQLARWSLTRSRNGDLRFGDKVILGSGYADLTSLQASNSFTYRHVRREYLYATTTAGSLQQIAVPVEQPGKVKVRTLEDSGYAGVTELSWSICNGKDTFTSLVAIDPVADTATWTTVRDSVTGPRARLRGPVSGGTSWTFVAAL